jgi:8-oxo-dGTP diphosphatase
MNGADAHLVTAGLLRRGDRGLLMHRSPTRRWYPDCWDLPGGHVEDGETPEAGLRRELLEELGITVVIAGAPFARVHGVNFRMDVWVIDQWDGDPVNLDSTEHDALALSSPTRACQQCSKPRSVIRFGCQTPPAPRRTRQPHCR